MIKQCGMGLNWIYLAQHRVQFRTLVTMLIRSGGSVEAGSFLGCVTSDQRLKNYSLIDIITWASCHFSVIGDQMKTSAAEITRG
jgi:hypothetical protein